MSTSLRGDSRDALAYTVCVVPLVVMFMRTNWAYKSYENENDWIVWHDEIGYFSSSSLRNLERLGSSNLDHRHTSDAHFEWIAKVTSCPASQRTSLILIPLLRRSQSVRLSVKHTLRVSEWESASMHEVIVETNDSHNDGQIYHPFAGSRHSAQCESLLSRLVATGLMNSSRYTLCRQSFVSCSFSIWSNGFLCGSLAFSFGSRDSVVAWSPVNAERRHSGFSLPIRASPPLKHAMDLVYAEAKWWKDVARRISSVRLSFSSNSFPQTSCSGLNRKLIALSAGARELQQQHAIDSVSPERLDTTRRHFRRVFFLSMRR